MVKRALRDAGLPRKPQQERARVRCERVLEEAKTLLVERGIADFSIPELATRLGYSRAAIYNFFSTPNAIFNELSQRYLVELEASLRRKAPEISELSWQDGAHAFAALAAKFYSRHPAARILILGAPVSSESYAAQASLLQRLGAWVEQRFVARGIALPKAPPNTALLSVEIGTACLRASFLLHGKVTPEYEREAGRAMVAYLAQYVDAPPRSATRTEAPAKPRRGRGSP